MLDQEVYYSSPPDGLAALHPWQLEYTASSFDASANRARQTLEDAWNNPMVRRGVEAAAVLFALIEGNRLIHEGQLAYSEARKANNDQPLSPAQLKDLTLSVLSNHIKTFGQKTSPSSTAETFSFPSGMVADSELPQEETALPDSDNGDFRFVPLPTETFHLRGAPSGQSLFPENLQPVTVQSSTRRSRWDPDPNHPIVRLATNQFKYYKDRWTNDPLRAAIKRRWQQFRAKMTKPTGPIFPKKSPKDTPNN